MLLDYYYSESTEKRSKEIWCIRPQPVVLINGIRYVYTEAIPQGREPLIEDIGDRYFLGTVDESNIEVGIDGKRMIRYIDDSDDCSGAFCDGFCHMCSGGRQLRWKII